jgi:hypothetical protein
MTTSRCKQQLPCIDSCSASNTFPPDNAMACETHPPVLVHPGVTEETHLPPRSTSNTSFPRLQRTSAVYPKSIPATCQRSRPRFGSCMPFVSCYHVSWWRAVLDSKLERSVAETSYASSRRQYPRERQAVESFVLSLKHCSTPAKAVTCGWGRLLLHLYGTDMPTLSKSSSYTPGSHACALRLWCIGLTS